MSYTVKELFLIEFSIGFFFFFHMGSLFTMTWVFGFLYFSSFCRKGGIRQVVSHLIWFPVLSF